MEKKIVIEKSTCFSYPQNPPFRPSVIYPEYKFEEISEQKNNIYDMVRDGFRLMGYDSDNFGTKKWNPLKTLIHKGDTVLLKPNLVMDVNQIKENGTDCLYTQPSIVAAVIDYVCIALDGQGKIIVGDAPMQECDFDKLIVQSGYQDMILYYEKKFQNIPLSIELVDFRGLKSKTINGVNHSEINESKGKVVDLGLNSEFSEESDYFYENMRITNYDPAILKQHHNSSVNEYYINDYVLNADVIINMPKPKTHRKAGVTISMKNLVGINCRKEYLPHHTNGSSSEGGDEYLNKSLCKRILDKICDRKNYYAQTKKAYGIVRIYNKFYGLISRISNKVSKDPYYEGSWYGNDTISRTIVDLNKILFYADKNGILQNEKQRKYLIVADMIISGEKEGPVAPTPKNVGIVAMGEDPVCFDEAILELMGAKLDYIKTVFHGRNPKGKYRITEEESIPIFISNDTRWNGKHITDIKNEDKLFFIPTSGWKEAFWEGNENE